MPRSPDEPTFQSSAKRSFSEVEGLGEVEGEGGSQDEPAQKRPHSCAKLEECEEHGTCLGSSFSPPAYLFSLGSVWPPSSPIGSVGQVGRLLSPTGGSDSPASPEPSSPRMDCGDSGSNAVTQMSAMDSDIVPLDMTKEGEQDQARCSAVFSREDQVFCAFFHCCHFFPSASSRWCALTVTPSAWGCSAASSRGCP